MVGGKLAAAISASAAAAQILGHLMFVAPQMIRRMVVFPIATHFPPQIVGAVLMRRILVVLAARVAWGF